MYDKLLVLGAYMDWITPLMAFVQDRSEGSRVDFVLPDDTGVSGMDIQRHLAARGIRSWGWMVVGNEVLFTVSRRQAQYAQYHLERAGVPYQGGLVEGGQWAPGPNAGWATKKEPARQVEQARGWWDKMFEW